MSLVRLLRRFWMLALAVVLGAGGFGLSLVYTGSAGALEVPTITTLPLPTPTVTAPLPTPTLPAPTPTVSVPTPTVSVPTPTLPAPTPTPTLPTPTPTLPAPTPTVSVPGVSVPTSPSAPAPIPSSPGSLSGGSPTGSVVLLGSGGTGPGGASGSSGSGAALATSNTGTTAAAPIWGSSATTRGIQVTNVRGRKGVVRIVFRLARGGRVVVTVRGPLPDCSRVARFVIPGRRGENALRFNGRAGGRRLAEGSYLVGLRPVRAVLTRWAALLIDTSGARALSPSAADSAIADCTSAVTPFAMGFLAGAEQRDALPVGGGEGAAGERSLRASVLGIQQLQDAADAIHPAVGIAILTVILTGIFWFILGFAFLVVSYVRGEGIARPRL
jgi:hypothetical protein